MSLVGGRYRLLETVGRGGMASVERALDTRTGSHVALKRLHKQDDERRRVRLIAHMEREFHTLAQLAHPCVVTVYDYGLDGDEPYYTMELLDGGDLQTRSPLDWRTACAVALDACSALSLLHSRRLVHRDLGPRNIRCTKDGKAKLIDFGAMVPMGPTRAVVGTPAVCAPEIVRLQPLDARTDLYALGATLYGALTSRMPYPARSFKALEAMWESPPPPPSAYAPDTPTALDQLVLELLQLDMSARPPNASEVTQRLCAIAGLKPDAQAVVSQAFLSTPSLVGREEHLAALRERMTRLARNKGRAIQVQGPAGVGRSRLLDACVLEGKLAGATVVRADIADATGGDYTVARALASRLLEATSGSAQSDGRNDHRLLLDWLAGEVDADPSTSGAELGKQLRSFVFAACRERPVMLVVDDAHRIDAPSTALLASLARRSRHNALLLVTSVPSEEQTDSMAQQALAKYSKILELANLNLDETEALLLSVFGDVPNLQLLAHRLFEVTEGRPRDLMQLAQHLVDKSLVRYDAGAWSLPKKIDTGDLPDTLALALKDRVAQLSADALRLAHSMALSDDPRFTFDECLVLSGHSEAARLMRSLDELLASEIAVLVGSDYALGPQGWVAALRSHCEQDDNRELRRSLARVYEGRNDAFRTAQHLFQAEDDDRGVDILFQHAVESQKRTDSDPDAYMKLLQALPAGWIAVYDHALALCERLERPQIEHFQLRRRVVGAAAYDEGIDDTKPYFTALTAQLSRDCGLDVFETLDPAMEPSERIKQALAAAQQRYNSLPERERVCEPVVAAGDLVRVSQTALAIIAETLDLELLRLLPSLAPLAPLAPACEAMHVMVQSADARLAARTEQARDLYLALLERVRAPDGAGLKETYRNTAEFGLMYLLCNVEAAMGLASALDWAKQIGSDPLHEANAYQGQALYYLWQGDLKEAERMKSRADRLMIERNRRRAYAGTHLLRELPAYALADDLTHVKHLIDSVSNLAERRPGWKPVHHYARGEHARIRGDYATALQELEIALDLAQAGTHQIWPHAAGAQVQTLCALDRYAEARENGEAHLAAAKAANLGYVSHYVRMPLAVALARLGDGEAAVREADEAIRGFVSLGATGLNLFSAYETRATVAGLAQDAEGFERYSSLAKEQLSQGGSRALAAKYQRLLQTDSTTDTTCASTQLVTDDSDSDSRFLTALQQCQTTQERAQQTLTAMLEECGATQGFLYAVEEEEATFMARQADHEIPSEIDALAREYLRGELDDTGRTATLEGGLPSAGVWTCQAGRTYRPVLLGWSSDGTFVTQGLGVLLLDSDSKLAYPVDVTRCLAQVGGLTVHDV